MSHIAIEGRWRAGSLRLGLSIAGSTGGVEFDEVIDKQHSIFASACALDEPCVSVDTDGGISLESLPTLERHREPKPPTCSNLFYFIFMIIHCLILYLTACHAIMILHSV